MSLKRLECFTVICDWPGCGADINADNWDYAGTDRERCLEDVRDSDWREGLRNEERHDFGLTGGSHYCDKHPAVWVSDPEQEAAMVAPYLLIHDGDTGNPDDDGRVSMVYDTAVLASLFPSGKTDE